MLELKVTKRKKYIGKGWYKMTIKIYWCPYKKYHVGDYWDQVFPEV